MRDETSDSTGNAPTSPSSSPDVVVSVSPARRAEITANWTGVRQRIEAAAARSGRDPASIRLVAVTKSASAAETQVLVDLGQRELGENRVQVLQEKVPLVAAEGPAGPTRWHMIGHLQRNKARKALELAAEVQTVDTTKLLEKLDGLGEEFGRTIPVWVEVNTSGEEQKYGCAPAEAASLVAAVRSRSTLSLQGLMTIAANTADESRLRACFQQLRSLADAEGVDGRSMGMSGDFEVAIEEGSTLVRVGSALFRRFEQP